MSCENKSVCKEYCSECNSTLPKENVEKVSECDAEFDKWISKESLHYKQNIYHELFVGWQACWQYQQKKIDVLENNILDKINDICERDDKIEELESRCCKDCKYFRMFAQFEAYDLYCFREYQNQHDAPNVKRDFACKHFEKRS